MATIFNITVPANALTLDAKRTGQITFTVANASARSVGAIAEIVPADPNTQTWFQIEQGATRHLDPHQTIQYTITVHVPENAPPQNYTFHLVVADETNPDDNFTDSPYIRVTPPAPPPPPAKKPFPWWIIVAVIVVLLIIIGIIVGVVSSNNQANANATATVQANAATQTAVFLNQQGATATAAANFATQTVVFLAQQGATQTAAFLNQQTALAATQTAASIFATQTQRARPTPTFTPRPPATITVSNNGAFLAQFSVAYNFSGGFQTQTTGQFSAGSSQSITIPGDASSISVQIQVNTGFGLRDACGAINLNTAQNASFSVSGTTFNSSCG